MSGIRVISYLSVDDVAELIHDSLTRDQAFKLITLIDANFADLQFTEQLYAALGDAIREELDVDNA